MGNISPSFILILGALLVPFFKGRARSAYVLALPLISLANLLLIPGDAVWTYNFLHFSLTPVRIDDLSLVFGYLFHIAAFIGIVFALGSKDLMSHVTSLLYAGSALGAVFAGDLVTLFLYWELLAITSVFLIWARRTDRAAQAGMRYIIFQIGSGVLLLAGIIVHSVKTDSISFQYLGLETPGGLLIFLAFGIKAAFPLAHTWLTDAYPEATPSGTVFLSAFTTKVAIYALARSYPGTEALVWVGVGMAAFPIFYAVIENDLRRVLCYSLINQLGFMVVGIGIGSELALNGAVSHAFNDVLFKGLLMMTMGAVLMRTGKINGSELGGLYKSMPKTTILCIIGAASISAFPLFSGFVSKSMVMSAALADGRDFVWLVLLFASAGVFHHAGIKIPYFAFFAHDSGIRCKEAPRHMLIAMSLAAFFCVFNGCFPNAFLYRILPYEVTYVPYTLGHIITQMQILFFSAMAFVWLNKKGLYPPELPSVNLDSDWAYRRLLPRVAEGTVAFLARINETLKRSGAEFSTNASRVMTYYVGPQGILVRSAATSTMALVVVSILTAILILYYIF